MYSDKENIQILTALLIEHGVQHVVVCPGSRNAPLVHNFHEAASLICHPATDERSAGFLALGLALQGRGPVAVCVTSGSALLNVLPAVAEASYQHRGIVVISADRPAQWIDQLDGQTLPQPDALGRFVAHSVDLPEPTNEEQRWYCARLVNEAFLALSRTGRSVHINVPITEPLFQFTQPTLPSVRAVRYLRGESPEAKGFLHTCLEQSARPLVVVGQLPPSVWSEASLRPLDHQLVWVYEPLSTVDMPPCYTDQMLYAMGEHTAPYQPDLLIYIGGHTVSKRLRQFLRQLPDSCRVIQADPEGQLRDVSKHTQVVLHDAGYTLLSEVFTYYSTPHPHLDTTYVARWNRLRQQVAQRHSTFSSTYSSFQAVQYLEQQMDAAHDTLCYANSMSVRLGTLFAAHYIFCNRGVNGIEGSLSTAAGMALAKSNEGQGRVFCVIGDLSFFYDQNALWQQQLSGNLRILLLNNQQGAIFNNLPGLNQSPAKDELIAARHHLSAQGVCQQFGVTYLQATDTATLHEGLHTLCTASSTRPVLLEVLTDVQQDEQVFKAYYHSFKTLNKLL